MTARPTHLAQLNIGRLRYEVNDPRMADFVDNLARVNAIADRAEGFIWRLQDATGNATSYRPYGDDPRMAINMSVWEDVAALERYVWQTVHKRFYGRREEWFERLDGTYFVMWWVPAGHIPTVEEAVERLEHLNRHGAHDGSDVRQMTKLIVDGKEIDVAPEFTLLQACEAAGAEIPRFCFHERLSIAGNCRMCLIEVQGMPKPQASCAMGVRDLPPNRD